MRWFSRNYFYLAALILSFPLLGGPGARHASPLARNVPDRPGSSELAFVAPEGPGAPVSRDPSGAEFALPQAPDRGFYTLNPELALDGPIQTGADPSSYVNDTFVALIRAAHAEARPYLDAHDPPAYWAMLVAGIAVPWHESRLQHFRQLSRLGTRCSDEMNSGAILRGRGDPNYAGFFQKYLRGGVPPAVLDCSRFSPGDVTNQLVGSSDGISIGLMQMNIRWHVDGYFMPRKYLSVSQTATYGLHYYFSGFNDSYLRWRSLGCLGDGAAGGPNPTALIRAGWAIFNAGPGSGCRFAQNNAADRAFYENLQEIVNDSAQTPFQMALTGPARAAYMQIIDNFANHRDLRDAVDAVLGEPGADPATNSDPLPGVTINLPSPAPAGSGIVREVVVDQISIHNAPSSDSPVCGTLPRGAAVRALSNLNNPSGPGGGGNDPGFSEIALNVPLPSSLAGCRNRIYCLSSALGEPEKSIATGRIADFHTPGGLFTVDVRQDPPRGAIINILQAGDPVDLVATQRLDPQDPYAWYQLRTSHGWIYGAYIDFGE